VQHAKPGATTAVAALLADGADGARGAQCACCVLVDQTLDAFAAACAGGRAATVDLNRPFPAIEGQADPSVAVGALLDVVEE